MNESGISSKVSGKSHFLKIKRFSSISNDTEKENCTGDFNTVPPASSNKRPQFFKSFSASSVISSKTISSLKQKESSPLKKKGEEPFYKQHSESNPAPYNKLEFNSNTIFKNSLKNSLNLASAEVVLQSDNVSFGKIPLIVAKCGSILKRHAISEPGIFRIAGNTKKIKLLEQIFSTPPTYGQEWKFDDDVLPNGFKRFSVHDVSGVLRRFLNNMNEPLIPLRCYNKFRNCLKENEILMRTLINKNNSDGKIFFTKEEELQLKVDYLKLKTLSTEEFNANLQENKRLKDKLLTQRLLIKEIRICLKRFESYIRDDLDDCNKQTLLYLLDLLFLFSQHSAKNLMDAKNLAAIFQPSVISHPEHDMNPKEYELSRIVLEFLINFSYKLLPNVFNIPKSKFQKTRPENPEQRTLKNQLSIFDQKENAGNKVGPVNGGSSGRGHSKSLSFTMNIRDNMELLRVVNKSETEEDAAELDDDFEDDKFDFEYQANNNAGSETPEDDNIGNNTTLDDAEYESGNVTMLVNEPLNS